MGACRSDFTEWTTPFAEWPEEIKKYWTYDPDGAEALLDAAGFRAARTALDSRPS